MRNIENANKYFKKNIEYLVIFCLIFLTIAIRLPYIYSELPPFVFCDEMMFSGETWDLLSSKTGQIDEFRAGGLNMYPTLLLQKSLNFIGKGATTFEEYLILGRYVHLIFFGCLTTLMIFALTNSVTKNYAASVFASLVFVLSPYVNSMSRYWYPDHFIALFSAIFLYVVVSRFNEKAGFKSIIYLAISATALISVKYTGLIVLPLCALTIIFNCYLHMIGVENRAKFTQVTSYLFVFGFVAMFSFFIFNPSVLAYPKDFAHGFMFNLNNYAGHEKNPFLNFKYYFLIVTIAFCGVAGGALFIVGSVLSVFKYRNLGMVIVGLFFLAALIGLSSSGLVLNRNISIVLPVYCLMLGVAYSIVLPIVKKKELQKYFYFAVIVWVGFLGVQASATFMRDIQPDSRVQAQHYISKHVNQFERPVGTNEFCSGESPATGLVEYIRDPYNEQNSEYFIYNTYWGGFLGDLYMGKLNFWNIPSQNLIHYYAFGQKSLFDFNKSASWPISNAKLHEKGYKLEKSFNGPGPEILILKSTDKE